LAMPRIRELLVENRNAIIESNSLLKFVRPDLYLCVLDPGTADFKDSSREFLDRANAVILHGGVPEWERVSLKPLLGKPQFRISPPPYVTPEIVEFVAKSLETPV